MTRGDDNQITGIITACKKGREDGFARLVELYASRLYGYFYRLSGNAEVSNDLLSELFVRLVEKIGSYESGSFDLWLFKIATNIFYDHLRQQRRQKKIIEGHKQQQLEEETSGTGKQILRQLTFCRRSLANSTSRLVNYCSCDTIQSGVLRKSPKCEMSRSERFYPRYIAALRSCGSLWKISMSERHNENLGELLARFFDDEQASKAAEDLATGQRIFDSHPAPKPSPALLADIKCQIAIAADLNRKRQHAHRFVWRAATAAAAIVVIAWAGITLWQNRQQMSQDMQAWADTSFWQETTENSIESKLAQLDDTDADLPVITFEINGNHDMIITDVTDELNEIQETFWEG